MTDKDLKVIYKFIKLSAQLKNIKRKVKAHPKRFESSAEHSWSLCFYCWLLKDYLEKEFDSDLNIEKLMKMAIIHDLVEINCGDKIVWDSGARKKKEKMEMKAAQDLFSGLPKELNSELISLWKEFEENKSLESKIVRGLDRLSGAVQRLVANQGWGDVNACPEDLDKIQLPKIGFSKTLTKLYQKIRTEGRERKLFQG